MDHPTAKQPMKMMLELNDMFVLASHNSLAFIDSEGKLIASTKEMGNAEIEIPRDQLPLGKIRHLAFHQESNMLAITTELKELVLINTITFELLQSRKLIKKSTKIEFCSESVLLVSDKFGDFYSINLKTNSTKLLMGHISILTDFLLINKYLVTCDRDEKIRINEFPNSFEIHKFCLGHQEFVGKLCKITNELFVSGGGDDYLLLWDIDGNVKQKFELDVQGLKFPETKPYVTNILFDLESNDLVVTFAGYLF